MGIERFVGAVLFNVRKYAFKSLKHKTKFMICIIKICIHYRFDYCSQSLIHVINIYSYFYQSIPLWFISLWYTYNEKKSWLLHASCVYKCVSTFLNFIKMAIRIFYVFFKLISFYIFFFESHYKTTI